VSVQEARERARSSIFALSFMRPDDSEAKVAKQAAMEAVDALADENERLQAELREKSLAKVAAIATNPDPGLDWDLLALRERADRAVAEAATLRKALEATIGACAPPVEALCAVHADARWLAQSTVSGLVEARDALRAAAAVLVAGREPT
jgi:hypothetical protein